MTTTHVAWYCPHFEPQRQEADPGNAKLSADILPKCIIFWIAPALSMAFGTSYWGSEIDDISMQDSETFGITDSGPITPEAIELIRTKQHKKHNTRQYMAHARCEDDIMTMRDIPQKADGVSPGQFNRYTDGELANPTRHHFAVGGFGRFAPDATDIKEDTPPPEQACCCTIQPWDSVHDGPFHEVGRTPDPKGYNRYSTDTTGCEVGRIGIT